MPLNKGISTAKAVVSHYITEKLISRIQWNNNYVNKQEPFVDATRCQFLSIQSDQAAIISYKPY